MGPFKLADFSGLDIGYNARLETYAITRDPRDRPSKALEVRVKRGDLGRKSGRGFQRLIPPPSGGQEVGSRLRGHLERVEGAGEHGVVPDGAGQLHQQLHPEAFF